MAGPSTPFQVTGEDDTYGVKLDLFEGPLDLLLFLIRKNEIDIYDIPIAAITRQFLDYVELIQTLNLEQAGDFVVMAATLMKIKSRMLLPLPPTDEEEAEDPREELVRRLLEYQRFKEAASWLEDQQEAYRDHFYRGAALDTEELVASDEGEELRALTLFELLAAFKQAMLDAPKIGFHEVGRAEVTSEERADYIMDVLSRKERTSFVDLVSGLPRIVLIVTFIALLELVRSQLVVARQAGQDGEVWIYRKASSDSPPPAPASPSPGPESHV
ncbi:MAG: segregation/condensation protein A [Candidatus Latescibacteria bacterium]|jgi:segregation and condensation protein A|nr:segregation/condensation protein A [Candidatus Latescibacterota bacterium]